MAELTFLLQKGEKILKDASRIQYAGVTMQNIGSGFGAATNNGLGSALFTSKQVKREGSIFDAKTVHLYLTNKRLIFCKAKLSLFSGPEKEVGLPIAEIYYTKIKGINISTKLTHMAIDLAVDSGAGSIDNVKFWFLSDGKDKRENERNEFLGLIKKSSL